MTTGFFSGSVIPPEQNSTDQLIDTLTAQVNTATGASTAATQAAALAAASASNASLSEVNTSTLAQQANNTLAQANTAIDSANTAVSQANAAVTQAATSATNAASSASSSSSSATSATASATTATTQATLSTNARINSETAQLNSEASAAASLASKNAAATSASNAAASASGASTSATSAGTSATTATTQAGNASSSASGAATSATNAGTQATNAAASASAAATSASNASTSASNASGSATTASNSAAAAAASAASVNDTNIVHKAGAETITGVKTFTTNTNLSSVNGGPLSGFRNRIINGAMAVDQRATGVTTVSNTFAGDRWKLSANPSGVTAAQNIGFPGAVNGSQRALQFYTVTANAPPTASQFGMVSQILEGVNTADLQWGTGAAKPVTVSFNANASVAGTVMSVALRSGSSCYVVPITLTGTASRYSITIPGLTTGTIPTGTAMSMELSFCHAAMGAGGTYTTATASTWLSGNAIAHTTQSNCWDTTGRYIILADVQMEAGAVATPFEVREYSLELQMCRRYYEKMTVGWIGYASSINAYVGSFQNWTVAKRAVPTLTLSTPSESSNAGTANITAYGPDCVRIFGSSIPVVAASFYTNVVSADAEI